MRILRLTLKKGPFDMIASGVKKHEYRTPSDWILSRLFNKDGTEKEYDLVQFKNGYGKDTPMVYTEFIGHGIEGDPNSDWSFGMKGPVIAIYLGNIVNYME